MSDDQNINAEALIEDNSTNAVSELEAIPQEEKLLAGKFKSPEELEKSYLELQREFSRKGSTQPRQETTEVDALAEVRPLLDAYAREAGLVSRTELEAQKREEENLNLYLASNPSAKSRLDKIKTLAQSDLFKGKSYAEIDNFLSDSSGSKNSRPIKMGSNSKSEGFEGENSPDELKDFFLKR